MTANNDAALMTPLRKRTIEINDEYDAARETQSEKVAVAQLALALARSEAALLAAQQQRDEALGDAKRWQNRANLLGQERQRARRAEETVTRLRDALEEISDTQRHKRKPKDWRMGYEIARAALALDAETKE